MIRISEARLVDVFLVIGFRSKLVEEGTFFVVGSFWTCA